MSFQLVLPALSGRSNEERYLEVGVGSNQCLEFPTVPSADDFKYLTVSTCPGILMRRARWRTASNLFFFNTTGTLTEVHLGGKYYPSCLMSTASDSVIAGACQKNASSLFTLVPRSLVPTSAVPTPDPVAPVAGEQVPIGAIVGGVVGGLALVALVAGVILYARHRRKDSSALSRSPAPSDNWNEQPEKKGGSGAAEVMHNAATVVVDDHTLESATAYSETGASPRHLGSVPAFDDGLTKKMSGTGLSVPSPTAIITAGGTAFPSGDALSYPFVTGESTAASAKSANTSVPVDESRAALSHSIVTEDVTAVSPVGSVPAAENVSDGSRPRALATRTGTGSSISSSNSKLLVSEHEVEIDRTRKLGEGGFGIVYVGKLRGTTTVAVKTIKGELDDRTMARFAKEVATWEGLVQRNVLPLMGFCIEPPMMIMDLAEANLRKYLKERNWDQKLGLRFMLEVATGMAYLHACGVLHGDLKSVNVLIDGGRAVIADFGLSRVRLEVCRTSTTEAVGGVRGTPAYIAPEVLTTGHLRPPADVYSFAMLGSEVVSRGRHPFDHMINVHAIMYQAAVEKARPKRPDDDVPDALWALIERCWKHEPADRPTFLVVEQELAGMQYSLFG
ncbi:kinase-like domain-containing protein [Hyaloraphidium curvatum]|nr:kinase-like domain-containing protein [Hyaloraphidium curvatum]